MTLGHVQAAIIERFSTVRKCQRFVRNIFICCKSQAGFCCSGFIGNDWNVWNFQSEDTLAARLILVASVRFLIRPTTLMLYGGVSWGCIQSQLKKSKTSNSHVSYSSLELAHPWRSRINEGIHGIAIAKVHWAAVSLRDFNLCCQRPWGLLRAGRFKENILTAIHMCYKICVATADVEFIRTVYRTSP